MALSGFLNIDKPQGITSHDVVAQIRRILKRDFSKGKVGHAGTLDPLATGVLVICVGQATRLSEYVMATTKTYRATLKLGIITDTYDADGTVTRITDASQITLRDIQQCLPSYIGEIDQLPPMYSAIKQQGKKLYELAREGKIVERQPRRVTIHSIEIVDWLSPELTLDIVCGSGTYIRSLAYDIGEQLGVGAHLTALRRTTSGAFDVQTAIPLQTLLDEPQWTSHVIAPKDALKGWDSYELSEYEADRIMVGQSIDSPQQVTTDFVMGYLQNGHLLAVLKVEDGQWKPHKVFLPQA